MRYRDTEQERLNWARANNPDSSMTTEERVNGQLWMPMWVDDETPDPRPDTRPGR